MTISSESTVRTPDTHPVPGRGRRVGRISGLLIPSGLGIAAALGWWWSVRMAADTRSMAPGSGMSMSLAAFLVGWAAMMAAMMFPAISPMVKMYAGAAGKGAVAPVPVFVAGYLVLWTATGLPGYFAWRALSGPLADGAAWTGRLAGAVFVAAAVYQLTPLKAACLQQCRSPISFFIRYGGSSLARSDRALRLGVQHGAFCIGCCWGIMAILVTLGTMNLLWMGALAVVISVEKVAPGGGSFAKVFAVLFGVAGLWLLADPSLVSQIT